MYRVLCDNAVLYDPNTDDCKITKGIVNLEVNKTGNFTFTVFPTNSVYGNINRLKSVIEVYRDSKLIFRGRPLNDTMGFYRGVTIKCLGDLDFFNDSIYEPYDFTGTISDFLQAVITAHNNQVEEAKHFALGAITVTDPNDTIVRSSIDYSTSWSVLSDALFNSSLGGYLLIRREDGVNYVDYLSESNKASTQIVAFGKNILDLTKTTKASAIMTEVIPLGAKLKDENGNDTNVRLNIEDVNEGVNYLTNPDAVAIYGNIRKVVVFNDVTDSNNLMTKGAAALALGGNLDVNIQINAVDLNNADASIDDFELFDNVKIETAFHDLDFITPINKMSIDILAPENDTIEVGIAYTTFTEKKLQSDKVIENIHSDYVKNDKITEINNSIETVSSSIEQTASNIRTEVSENYVSQEEYTTYQESVSTQFTQTAEGFEFQFNQVNQTVSDQGVDIEAEVTERKSAIRFDDDGNIILGKSESAVTLKLENDQIAFYSNDAKVSYWEVDDNGVPQFYVTDGQFLNSLVVGNFGFIPRANGSLSFGKVK